MIFKIPRSKGASKIEELSKRYELSENFTSKILLIMDDPNQTGDFYFDHEDEKYSINIKIRESDLDIHLRCCQIMENIDW